jgi:hypothetical protein
MGIRDRLKRLQAKVEEGAVVVHLRDGSIKVFDALDVQKETFLARCDLLKDTARDSEVLDAVRTATPESRREFEERFGPIGFTEYIITPVSRGGQVEAKTLTEDGRVERVLYEGDSQEATLVREGLMAGRASEVPVDLPRPPLAGRWVDEPAEDLCEESS